MTHPAEEAVNEAIRAAWAVTIALNEADDSRAVRELAVSVQDLADRRTPGALAECARRFDVVSVWSSTADPSLAHEAAAIARRLRGVAVRAVVD